MILCKGLKGQPGSGTNLFMRIKITFIILAVSFISLACSDCPKCPEVKKNSLKNIKSENTKKIDTDMPAPDSPEKDPGDVSVTPGKKPKNVTTFPLYARAGFDRVSIWSKPDMESPRLGYMRKGQRTMAGNVDYATEQCKKGWFKLPEGGFVCQGRGVLVGTKPRYIHHPPPLPLVDELEPYKHGFIRSDFTPSYKRIPALEAIWKVPVRYVPGVYEIIIPDESQEQEKAMPDTNSDSDSAALAPLGRKVEITVDENGDFIFPDGVEFEKDDNGEYKLPKGVVVPTEEIPNEDPDAKKEDNPEAEEIHGIDYKKYARKEYPGIRSFLARGFWISVARRFRDDATKQFYYETIKGEYVPANSVHMIKPPEFHGYEVLGDTPLPAAIVKASHAAFYQQRKNRFRGIGPVDRLNVYRVFESVKSGANTYYRINQDRWLKDSQVAYFELQPPPESIAENEKWIRINLTEQTLEAYEGTTPVFVTLISSGIADSEETVTPTGEFSIKFKHLTDDMTGSVGDGEDVYSVADVPWVQYIYRNIALHASFWHSKYGNPKSHGCINLSPADARFLFNWTDPKLPEKWHGIAVTGKQKGTRVFIVGKTPKR